MSIERVEQRLLDLKRSGEKSVEVLIYGSCPLAVMPCTFYPYSHGLGGAIYYNASQYMTGILNLEFLEEWINFDWVNRIALNREACI